MAKIIAGNFKMNKTKSEVASYCKELLALIAKDKNNFIIIPPFTLISTAKEQLGERGSVGAQNCAIAEKGAYTGEISAEMVADSGAKYCLIGHSERRHIFGETNEDVCKKIDMAQNAGLHVILCVGELLEEHNKLKSVLKAQLNALKGKKLNNVIVAYEPVWAIGTGKVATKEDIVKAHLYIKEYVKKEFNTNIKVLYGGSVKPENCKEILALDCVDGVLVGGASLDAKKMAEMIKIAK